MIKRINKSITIIKLKLIKSHFNKDDNNNKYIKIVSSFGYRSMTIVELMFSNKSKETARITKNRGLYPNLQLLLLDK